MKKKELFEIFEEFSRDMGYWHGIPESKYDELADRILVLKELNTNWEKLDPIKWRGINGESNQ